MAGKQTPLVLIPRYTSFVGPTQFYMDPLPVSAYSAFSVTLWVGIYAGGAHHTGFSLDLTAEHLADFAEMAGMEFLLIDQSASVASFKKELRWNDLYYHLAKGL